MMSGEGMQPRKKVKNNDRSKQQKQLCTSSTLFYTFLCRCFARLQRENSRNFSVTRFMQEMSNVFPFIFLFTAAHFHLALVDASISHLIAATKFSCCSSNKKKMSPLFFISHFKSLSPFFSSSFAGCRPRSLFLSFSVFLLLYIPNLWT